MKIISFGDAKVIPIYEHLITSAFRFGHNLNHEFIFYTNDKNITSIKGVTIKYFEVPKVTRRFVFHKPNILLQATKEFPNEDLLYLDVDILLGKRFNPEKMLQGKQFTHPLVAHHTLNWDPSHRNGVLHILNQTHSQINPKHIPIAKMDWEWVQTCCIAFNSSHKSFLEKWKDTCYSYHENYTGDEAAYNSLFNFQPFENLGKIHVNFPNIQAFKGSEETFWDRVKKYEQLENHYFWYDLACLNTPNTSQIMFYHGCQYLDKLENYYND